VRRTSCDAPAFETCGFSKVGWNAGCERVFRSCANRTSRKIKISRMGVYSKFVLPRLIDLVMKREDTAKQRRKLIPRAAGDVLEIAIGSGLNLPFYGRAVTRLFGVDPSPELVRIARSRAGGSSFPVEFLERSAESLPFADASMDTVVVTWGLCSMSKPTIALGEMKRVLKPGGRLLFAEHGRAPDASVERWQNRVNPIWRAVAGGCNLNRKIDDLIRGAGFAIDEMESEYLPGPRIMTFTYRGAAA
jgi:SAM-dependent methyltransferase